MFLQLFVVLVLAQTAAETDKATRTTSGPQQAGKKTREESWATNEAKEPTRRKEPVMAVNIKRKNTHLTLGKRLIIKTSTMMDVEEYNYNFFFHVTDIAMLMVIIITWHYYHIAREMFAGENLDLAGVVVPGVND